MSAQDFTYLESYTIHELEDLEEAVQEEIKRQRADLKDRTGGCSCHISPPCSFCVEGGHPR